MTTGTVVVVGVVFLVSCVLFFALSISGVSP
jgi:hypothetical protein